MSLFPIQESQIYLNHAGVSPLPRPAAEALERYARECSELGVAAFREWLPRVAEARSRAAHLIGAADSEIGFIKSTTQGLQMIAWGIDWKPDDVVILEEKPFPANWWPWKWAEKCGANIWLWPERGIRYEIEELETRLREGNVRVVAVCSANFGTGFRHDLKAIGELCRKHGALFVVDGIQTVGAFPLDVRECHIDFLSADGHKWMLGPESAGIIYARPEALTQLGDHVVGWVGRKNFIEFDNLELEADPTARRFEEGAPNYGGNQALGAALKILLDTGIPEVARRIRANAEILEDGLEANGWEVVSKQSDLRCGIVASRKNGIDTDAAAKTLWERAKINCNARRGFLRLAPHFYNTQAEMERVVEEIGKL